MEFNLILEGKDEFKFNNNKIYYILVIDNKENENFMISIFNTFLIKYLGIDFEFNNVSKENIDVALMQINLENDDTKAYIFLLNPLELLEENYNKLIDLLTNKDIIKILHGGESLDIPYLFNQLLISKENINNFCINFYDTKYLCEYYKIDNNKIDLSCGIYNLLVHQNIITQKKLEELEKIEDKIGPLWLINIDVYNLKNNLLKYCLYDVLFLPELIKNFLIKKNIYYTYIIPEISCLIYKYKKNIENQFLHLEKIINKMNIYFIKIDNEKYLLINIWNIYNDIIFEKIKDINYFKKFFKIISKFLLYYNINKKYDIYFKNNLKINNINFDFFFKWLNRYTYTNELVSTYNILINNEI